MNQTRTAATRCSTSAMIVLPSSNLGRMSRASAQGGQAPDGKAQGVRHGRFWCGLKERKIWNRTDGTQTGSERPPHTAYERPEGGDLRAAGQEGCSSSKMSTFWAFASRVWGALLYFFRVFSVPDFALFHDPAPTPPVSDALRFPAWGFPAWGFPALRARPRHPSKVVWRQDNHGACPASGCRSPGRLHRRVGAVDHPILRDIAVRRCLQRVVCVLNGLCRPQLN